MSKIIDARGLSCPEPVIVTRNELQDINEGEVTVLVSSSVARDNVTRAAKSMGWKVTVDNDGDDFKLNLEK